MANFRLMSSTSPSELGSLEEILSRSLSGCPFCTLVLRSVCRPNEEGLGHRNELRHVHCQANWEIDGRSISKTEDPPSGHTDRENSARGLTRRIHLKWKDGQLRDSYLVFVANTGYSTTASDAKRVWGNESLFLGRKIGGGGHIQARVKSWIDLCQTRHQGPCARTNSGSSARFRDMLSHSYFGVIDVVNMHLTELPTEAGSNFHSAPYAALSYVWGDAPSYITTVANVTHLSTHGGLETVLSRLPLVIRNAIDLVRRLGFQYLWVDALCIIQDRPESWRHNAYNMDLIYGNAAFTICAADGEDASTALEAMKTEQSPTQEMADCAKGVRLMVSRPPEMYIKAAKWNTRAWTFQERLLSRRCLIFTGGRVYFQCRSTGMSEDIYADRAGAGWSLDFVHAPMQMFRQLSREAFWVYIKCVQLYTLRDLSKPQDVLAAFSGLCNLLEGTMRASFIFGLPSSHFDIALLWQHAGYVNRRISKVKKDHREYGDMGVPSWSWCGWEEAAAVYREELAGDCLEDTKEWLETRTWIRWHIRDGRGDLRPLWDPKAFLSDSSTEDRWRGYGRVRASGGSVFSRQSGGGQKPHFDRSTDSSEDESYIVLRRSTPSTSIDSDVTGGSEQSSVQSRSNSLPRRKYEQRRASRRGRNGARESVNYSARENTTISEVEEQPRTSVYLPLPVPNRKNPSIPRPNNSAYPPPPPNMLLPNMPPPNMPPPNMLPLSIARPPGQVRLLSRQGFLQLLRVFVVAVCQLLHLLGARRVEDCIYAGFYLLMYLFRLVDKRTAMAAWQPQPRLPIHPTAQLPPAPMHTRSGAPIGAGEQTKAIINKPLVKLRRRGSSSSEEWDGDRRMRLREATREIRGPSEVPVNETKVLGRRESMRYSRRAARYTVPSSDLDRKEVYHSTEFYDMAFKPEIAVSPRDTEKSASFEIPLPEYPFKPKVARFSRKPHSFEFPLMPILQFWTWHTHLHIQPQNTHSKEKIGNGLVRCHIADDIGDWCGSIILDERWIKKATSARQEFIAISEAKKFTAEECDIWTYYIPTEREQSEWQLFNVLLIERKDAKWERVGLGKVFKEAFRETRWKEIILG
jgi:hypothetical protein